MYDIHKMRKKVKRLMDNPRYWHTIGVMYTSGSLAMAHSEDMDKAMVAGLLHDSGKCLSEKEKLDICKKGNLEVTPFEKKHTYLLHSKIGAYIAKNDFDVQDKDVLNAITYHTTGRANMSKLEEIVYIADYIEPSRNKAKNLEEIRELAFRDLDLCMYTILRDTIEYLSMTDIDEHSLIAYNYYKELINKRNIGEVNE